MDRSNSNRTSTPSRVVAVLSATVLAVSGLTFFQPALAGPLTATAQGTTAAAAGSYYFVAEGFPKRNSTLSDAMKTFIRKEAMIRPSSQAVTSTTPIARVVCTGTVRGSKWTAQREKLALERATAGCDYVETVLPNVPKELKKRLISKKNQNSLTVRIRVVYSAPAPVRAPAPAPEGPIQQAANPSGIAQYFQVSQVDGNFNDILDANGEPIPALNEPLSEFIGAFPNLASITTSSTVKRFLVDLTRRLNPFNPNDPPFPHRPDDYTYDTNFLIPETGFNAGNLQASASLVKGDGTIVLGQIYVSGDLNNVFFFMDGAVDHTSFTYATSGATLEDADYISVTYNGETYQYFLYQQIVQ